jgi:hypothetical protein
MFPRGAALKNEYFPLTFLRCFVAQQQMNGKQATRFTRIAQDKENEKSKQKTVEETS